MSTLRTNALEGVDAKNSITIVAGAGNVTTTNVQEGLCKVWSTYEQDTNSLENSFNVSSQSDDATGRTTITFSNSFNNVDYSFTGTVFDGTGANDVRVIGHDNGTDTYTTSALKFYTCQSDGTLNDAERLFSQFMGDLA